MDTFLNGKMIPSDQARIAADDAGFQHSVGLFETMIAQNGRVFRLQNHVGRLRSSAKTLGLSKDLNAAALAEAVRMTIEHNKIDRARLRLTVTPGSMSLLAANARTHPGSGDAPGTVLIQPTEPTEYDPRYFDEGITVLVAQPGANPFDAMAGHKTLAYWPRLRVLRQAASVQAGEAIWLNVSNHLASGCISNVFLVKEGQLLTPIARGEEADNALPAPVLPGITRAAVIELAEGLGVTVKRQMLSIDDLLEADEVFLTNSSWHILPVSKIEKAPVGEGKAGDLTKRLRTDLLNLIERETSAE